MKTFLWTTLFRIVAAIAWLLCLGFGNLWTQVLDNTWMIKFLPENMQTRACEPVVASALENVDWCAAAEANSCYPTIENEGIETWANIQVQETLDNIITNQQIIYSYLQESFTNTNQAINNIQPNNSQDVEEPIIDEKEQQRLQLQAQIEALQNEMANL